MNENENAAFIFSQAACALITAMGMMAENVQRERNGYSPAYGKNAFEAVIDEYGIGHNATLTKLRPQDRKVEPS